jgi:hypothetical protein
MKNEQQKQKVELKYQIVKIVTLKHNEKYVRILSCFKSETRISLKLSKVYVFYVKLCSQ